MCLPEREFGGRNKDPKGASIYLDSLPSSIGGNASCLLVPPFLVFPFKIKLEAAKEHEAPPKFPFVICHVKARAVGLQLGVRVCWEQQLLGGGWEGAQVRRWGWEGGWPLYHQGSGQLQ